MRPPLGPFSSVKALRDYVEGLQGLRTFWTGRVKHAWPLGDGILLVEWRLRRPGRSWFLLEPREWDSVAWEAWRQGCSVILITRDTLHPGVYDRWSRVYMYTRESRLLEPNTRVKVDVYSGSEAESSAYNAARMVQESSWGFYMPPPRGDHAIIASIAGEPVSAAYYNPRAGSIDYGVHVKRPYWRRRIGTRLLHEALNLAYSTGRGWLTVIRLIRGKKPTRADRRAMAFYEANNPPASIQRLQASSCTGGGTII